MGREERSEQIEMRSRSTKYIPYKLDFSSIIVNDHHLSFVQRIHSFKSSWEKMMPHFIWTYFNQILFFEITTFEITNYTSANTFW